MYERFLREPIPASIGPGKRFKRRLKKVYLRLPCRPLVRFLYAYVFRLGFLDGYPGLVFCGLLAFYDFLCGANALRAAAPPASIAGGPGHGASRRARLSIALRSSTGSPARPGARRR